LPKNTMNMINTQLLVKKLRTAAFAAVLLLGTSAVFAQVKIGTNPTVIDPANNLEVEASTAGRKTSVNKTTGQVTIADGTQGDRKVLTSDANGGASWEQPTAQSTDVWVYAKQTAVQNVSGLITNIIFNSEINDRGNNYDPGTGKITVPTTGIYQINCGIKKTGASTNNGAFNLFLAVYVNGVIHTAGYEDAWQGGADNPRASLTANLLVNAGDIIDIRITSNYAPYPVGDGYLTFIKLSN
jgi:hypothetical protein